MRGKVEIKIPGWVYEKLEKLSQDRNKTVEEILIEIVKRKLRLRLYFKFVHGFSEIS